MTWGSVFYTFSLLMGPVERELGLSRADASLGFSLALLADGLMAYPIGRWIDQGHERRVMAWGSAWVGACLLAHSFIESLASFYVVWIGLGLGMSATLYAPVFAVVTRRFPNDFRRAIIIMTFLGGLASTVFIPLSSLLIQAYGCRHALWILALFQWLICLPLHAVLLRGAIQVLGRFLLFLFEKHLDVHAANKWIPCLVPLGLLCWVAGGLATWSALLFVLFYGLGNGLNTIVKGTAMAQYVSREHVGQLNGILGVPLAMGRAVAPWALGLMWTPEEGYTQGLRCLLLIGVIGVACLWWAQKSAHKLGANNR